MLLIRLSVSLFSRLENINPEENDMTLQELLNRINNADTGVAIQKNGAIIVDRIYKTKACKKRITAEEMNAVIEERDAALSQVTACICESIYYHFPPSFTIKK